MEIVQYPHPTLRYQSKPVVRVDRKFHAIVEEMFELMYDARGIGLAANQVDLPLQLFILNLTGGEDKEDERVFINPVVSAPKGKDTAEEGCLSLVGVSANVTRPKQIHISAYDLQGNRVDQTIDGLFARAVQHEYDHLQGILFIDRVKESAKRYVLEELEEFEIEFQSLRELGKIADDATIFKRLAEIESQYCQTSS